MSWVRSLVLNLFFLFSLTIRIFTGHLSQLETMCNISQKNLDAISTGFLVRLYFCRLFGLFFKLSSDHVTLNQFSKKNSNSHKKIQSDPTCSMVNDPATNCLEFISNSVGEMGVFLGPKLWTNKPQKSFWTKFSSKNRRREITVYLFWLKTNPNIKMISLAGHYV